MTIRLPMWLFNLLFGRQLKDLKPDLTGKATRTVTRGAFEAQMTVEKRK